jgi:hypothetical protein
MRRFSSALFACFCLLGPLPGPLWAEPTHAESIEWVVAGSDRVVVGKVVKVKRVVGKDRQPYELATVDVSRTLKGPPTGQVTFLLPNYGEPVARQWLQSGVPSLFCLVSIRRSRAEGLPRSGVEWALRAEGDRISAIPFGGTQKDRRLTIQAFTRDFGIVTEPEQVIKAIATFTRSLPRGWQRQSHLVEVPRKTAVHNKLFARNAVFLKVPVEGHLERLGRSWCLSENYGARIEGVKILRRFKNDVNIGMLKAFLKDTGSSEESRSRTRPGGTDLVLVYRKRVYEVRQLAYEALQAFGVKVKAPVLEVLLEGPEP